MPKNIFSDKKSVPTVSKRFTRGIVATSEQTPALMPWSKVGRPSFVVSRARNTAAQQRHKLVCGA